MTERDDPQDKALAALYREVSREAPSAGLDARILAAARATTPPRASNSWVNRWKIPVALAATVVLTTSITLLVQDEEAGRLDAPQMKRAAPPTATETAAQPAPAPASAPPAAAAKPAGSHRNDIRKESRVRVQDASPNPVREESPAAAAARAETAPPQLSRSPGADSSSERKAAADAPAAEAPRSAPARAAPPSARQADSATTVTGAGTARTPDQWIADIRRFKQEGKTAEAEASLAEFRKLYPWYVLPDDLRRP